MNVAAVQLDDQRAGFLERFGFEDLEIATTLEGGMFSRPMLVEADGARYLLRTHTFRATAESFQFQADTLNWAAEHGVPCAQLVPSKDGSWCQSLADGGGVLALHEFVEGATDDWRQWHARKESQPGFLSDLGRQVARLHNVLRRAPVEGEHEFPFDLPPIQFDRLEDVRRQWDRDLERLACSRSASPAVEQLVTLRPRIAEHWRRLSEAVELRLRRLPRQIVHGDVSPVNLVLGPDARWTFIDWDCVHVGWRIYDALGDVLNRPPIECPELNHFRADHVDAYLGGYRAELDEPLSDAEEEMIPFYCLARQLEDLRQRMRTLPGLAPHQDAEYATLITRRVEMMDQIAQI